MANVKKGQTVPAPEWWKHLKWAKRAFWKQQRQADKREAARSMAAEALHLQGLAAPVTQEGSK